MFVKGLHSQYIFNLIGINTLNVIINPHGEGNYSCKIHNTSLFPVFKNYLPFGSLIHVIIQ